MTNEKAREIVNYVLNPKCANGSNGLGLLNTHNQRNADLNNIYKCSEEIALQMAKWKDEQFAVLLKSELAQWQGNSAEAKYRREMLKELLDQFK